MTVVEHLLKQYQEITITDAKHLEGRQRLSTVSDSNTFEFASAADILKCQELLAKRLTGDVLQVLSKQHDTSIIVDSESITGADIFQRGEAAVKNCRIMVQHLGAAAQLVRVCSSRKPKKAKHPPRPP